ncbi:hypothetical protein EGW08_000994 [Elysia chlorotica]|uniref:Uncharacterized protein n=1 Tax=Elysia chlorotica TaxID=188477 RepID=A0A433UBZ5_ELYCH|nr:hypothetical protein EGW08_000994 [Elysia chlorotica]
MLVLLLLKSGPSLPGRAGDDPSDVRRWTHGAGRSRSVEQMVIVVLAWHQVGRRSARVVPTHDRVVLVLLLLAGGRGHIQGRLGPGHRRLKLVWEETTTAVVVIVVVVVIRVVAIKRALRGSSPKVSRAWPSHDNFVLPVATGPGLVVANLGVAWGVPGR